MKLKEQSLKISPHTIQLKRCSTSLFVDNRPEFIALAKFICDNSRLDDSSIQRRVVPALSGCPLQRKILYYGLEVIDANGFLVSLQRSNDKAIMDLSMKLETLIPLLQEILSQSSNDSVLLANLNLYRDATHGEIDVKTELKKNICSKYPGVCYSSVVDSTKKELKSFESVVVKHPLLGKLEQLLIISANPLEIFINELCSFPETLVNVRDKVEAIGELEKAVNLYAQHILALHHSTKADKTLEMQALTVGSHTFITSNPKGFIPKKSLEMVSSIDQQAPGIYFVNPPRDGLDTHAEIILLAQLIRLIFEKGIFPGTLYLGGMKPPCGKCKRIIDKFLECNQGEIDLKYIESGIGRAFGMDKSRSETNVASEKDTYVNALFPLNSEITQETINAKYPPLQEHEEEIPVVRRRLKVRNWLIKILDVINFRP